MNKNKEEYNHKNKICTQSTFSNLLILAIASHFNGEVVSPKMNIKRIASIKNVKLSKIQNYFHFGSPISSQRHILQFVLRFHENTKSSQHMFSINQLVHSTNLKQGNKQHWKVRKNLFLFFIVVNINYLFQSQSNSHLKKSIFAINFYFFFK